MKRVDTTLERLNDRDDVLGALGIRGRDLDSQRAGGGLGSAEVALMSERRIRVIDDTLGAWP